MCGLNFMSKLNRYYKTSILPLYTIGEEIANSILHGIGTLLAIAGFILLSLKTIGFFGREIIGDMDTIAIFIFTITMIGMFLISTLYHAIQHQDAKRILRRLDHCVIFIFVGRILPKTGKTWNKTQKMAYKAIQPCHYFLESQHVVCSFQVVS